MGDLPLDALQRLLLRDRRASAAEGGLVRGERLRPTLPEARLPDSRPINLIFYDTHSAFEQTNIILNFIPEGTGAFATPVRNRMVLPVDLAGPSSWR